MLSKIKAFSGIWINICPVKWQWICLKNSNMSFPDLILSEQLKQGIPYKGCFDIKIIKIPLKSFLVLHSLNKAPKLNMILCCFFKPFRVYRMSRLE